MYIYTYIIYNVHYIMCMYIHIMCVYKYYIKSGIQRLVKVSGGWCPLAADAVSGSMALC